MYHYPWHDVYYEDEEVYEEDLDVELPENELTPRLYKAWSQRLTTWSDFLQRVTRYKNDPHFPWLDDLHDLDLPVQISKKRFSIEHDKPIDCILGDSHLHTLVRAGSPLGITNFLDSDGHPRDHLRRNMAGLTPFHVALILNDESKSHSCYLVLEALVTHPTFTIHAMAQGFVVRIPWFEWDSLHMFHAYDWAVVRSDMLKNADAALAPLLDTRRNMLWASADRKWQMGKTMTYEYPKGSVDKGKRTLLLRRANQLLEIRKAEISSAVMQIAKEKKEREEREKKEKEEKEKKEREEKEKKEREEKEKKEREERERKEREERERKEREAKEKKEREAKAKKAAELNSKKSHTGASNNKGSSKQQQQTTTTPPPTSKPDAPPTSTSGKKPKKRKKKKKNERKKEGTTLSFEDIRDRAFYHCCPLCGTLSYNTPDDITHGSPMAHLHRPGQGWMTGRTCYRCLGLAPRARVLVQGLKGAPQYNGCHGTVLSTTKHPEPRIQIVLTSKGVKGKTLSVRRENLTPCCAGCLERKSACELKLCSRCQIVSYCSIQCQRKKWTTHQEFCTKYTVVWYGEL